MASTAYPHSKKQAAAQVKKLKDAKKKAAPKKPKKKSVNKPA